MQAQVPQSISYQAVARDANGNCLENQTISLQITILQDSMAGAPIYRERFENNVHTNSAGHFQIEIGTGLVLFGFLYTDFSKIIWNYNNGQRHFLKVEYSPQGASIFEEVGITELLSVPYALSAGNGKLVHVPNKDEYIHFYGTNGTKNVEIGAIGSNNISNNGRIRIYDEDDKVSVDLRSVPSTKAGWIDLYGPNGNRNIELSHLSSANNPNKGAIRVRGENNDTRATLYVDAEERGRLTLAGPNGSTNVELTSTSNLNRGRVLLRDENGAAKADIYINDSGVGVKSFVMPHPSQPDKEIVYACLEGPEVAAYQRGTSRLVNGEAFIPYSEHFRIVANPSTITTVLTPLSVDSKGLAVVEKTAEGFKVKELFGGTGNYDFDWRIEGVRIGAEDFQVVRDKSKDFGIPENTDQ